MRGGEGSLGRGLASLDLEKGLGGGVASEDDDVRRGGVDQVLDLRSDESI